MKLFTTIMFSVLLASLGAKAQTSSALKDKPAVKYNEIERGAYFGVWAGPFYMLNPPAPESTPKPFSAGQLAQVSFGVDFGPHVALEVLLLATANRTNSEYLGNSGGGASGDIVSLVPGAAAKVSLFGFDDGMDVKRLWVYVRAGGGYAMFFPKSLLPDNDILLFGGLGLEYFTRLRHFSVGLEASGQYFLSAGTIGFAVTPTVRYAF